MHIGIIGVNFRSADLSLREKMAQRIQSLASATSFQKIYRVILSTCNRFEIYFSAKDSSDAHSFFLEHLRGDLKEDCGFKLYAYFGKECFNHLCRVTAGLDSAIVAETEIQGQVKRAYLQAPKESLNSELHFIFQKSLKIGKMIRSEIPPSTKIPGLTTTLKKMLESLLQVKERPDVLFVGTSEMNQNLIHVVKKMPMNFHISSRCSHRLEQFASKNQMIPFEWKNLNQWHHFDGIVLASSCSDTLIQTQIDMSEKKRLILDLSVPRNACPKVHGHLGAQLWNIDQLNKVVRKQRKIKANDLMSVDFLVQRAVFKHWSLFKHRREYAAKISAAV